MDYLEIARSTGYFGYLEGGPEVGELTKQRYFKRPELMAYQKELRKRILANWWQQAGPPLTVEDLYAMGRDVVGGDLGTAQRVEDWLKDTRQAPQDFSLLRPDPVREPQDVLDELPRVPRRALGVPPDRG